MKKTSLVLCMFFCFFSIGLKSQQNVHTQSDQYSYPTDPVVREKLEQARTGKSHRPFMRLAGTVKGPKDLSSHKGFSRS